MNRINEKNKKDLAVALQYEPEKDGAPRVVASGKGELAQKILETARKFNIPVKKDEDLVRILIKLNIGDEIPQELYGIIAEILSFFYFLENKE